MKRMIVTLPTLAGIMWGATGIFSRGLNRYGMNSATILETRMLIGTIILAVGCLIMDSSLLKIRKKDIWVFIGGSVLGNLGLSYFYVEAINRLSMAFAAVLLCTFPVFVMLLSAILFGEKITAKKVCCMVFAFVGCFFVSGLLENDEAINYSVTGVVIGVLAAFCYALYSIFSKVAKERGYSSITITFYFMMLITFILAPMTNWNIIADYVMEKPVANMLFLIAHSLCAAVLPYLSYTFALAYMDAGKASVLATSEPVAAMVFGYFIFSEVPTALMLLGMLLTIAVIIILSLPERKKPIILELSDAMSTEQDS